MTLGEKIRYLRKERKMTQSELAGEKITRNMLSAIESDKASPSLDTLNYLAEKLSIPLPHLFTAENDYSLFDKNGVIDELYSAYRAKSFKSVVKIAAKLSKIDDEVSYLLACSHFEIGKSEFNCGALKTASANFVLSSKYCGTTVHNTDHITPVIKMYQAIINNIQSPLLELDSDHYSNLLDKTFNYELFKYLTLDSDYKFENKVFEMHLRAKKLIKDRDYQAAIRELLSAVEINASDGYNAFVMFSIYSDLETCYKQLYDFENAYKYSSKRLSLIEGFKS